jgi:hypothetical protein
MAPKQRYEGVIEEWPSQSLLYVPALPGFIASAPTREELIELSLPALDLHLAWLEGHGYPPALEDEGGLFVAGDLPANDGAGPLFSVDLVEPNPDAIELALALGRVAISDVIDIVDALEEASAAGPDVTRVIRHICVLDIWHSTRLGGPDPALHPIADAIDAMVAAAGMFEDRVDEVNESGERGIVALDGEDWTLAKLLRRRTAHIREHAMELADLLPGA